MKVQSFDKQNLKQIRHDINTVLKVYGDTVGFDIQLGNIKFSNAEFSTSMSVKIAGATTKNDIRLTTIMNSFKLGVIGIGGREITGYNSRAHAYPIQYTQAGKRFKCSVEQARIWFAQ